VESIRVTRAYIDARKYSPFASLLAALKRRRHAASPDHGSVQDKHSAGARRLVHRAVTLEYLTIILTLVTLALSTYALSGHAILDDKEQTVASYAAIGTAREGLLKEMPAAAWLDGADPFAAPAYCDPANPSLHAGKIPTDLPVPGDAPEATLATWRAVVLTGSHSCALYWQTKEASENLEGATLHLMSWTSVVEHTVPGWFFGINPASIRKSAERHPELCRRLSPPMAAGGCPAQLIDLVSSSREAGEAVLASITLDWLPTLYSCLGAAAAALRNLRRKVESSLVTMSDRGRVQQDVILGVLCGAMIGLFAGYVGSATPGTGLGLSALAVLGGYNISAVFAFLDELSRRIFQPASTGQPNTQPG
jgi:hypothetical protein